MDQTGIWKLFFATGLPECYLAARAQREDRGAPPARRKKDSPSAGGADGEAGCGRRAVPERTPLSLTSRLPLGGRLEFYIARGFTMHMRTKALVLRETAYKESDKILTLLTREAGKLTASARGCRKKGSAIAAGSQLLVWSDMVLYEYQGRWSVQEAAVEREFRGMRTDIVKFALGCYCGEVAELLAVEGLPNQELLSLLLNTLHALDKLDRPLPLVKSAFELRCLCLAGYGPLLDGCAVCGKKPSGGAPVPPAGGGAPLRPLPGRGGGTGSPCPWAPAPWPPWGTSSTGTPSGCSPSSWERRG